ncbi:MAG: tripartite tricarboxylate transporter permease [Desulfovibrio sp.]|uniref:tripartite tricarboxylate transporter permease n=1 Tax=Desulfovibrio sp. TaxID=885 RepID=UPI0025B98B74|nr:tripartite tricarboxylate transporter permease [Desulfovibrio sp.]MCI7568822.1 tripartite tricarboxylate transporter permease [Desulfovibrio sp.]
MFLDLTGTSFVFEPLTLVVMLAGVFGGLIIGAIPGLTSTMAVALLVPVTYGMEAHLGLALLVAVYMGSISGGLVAATLLNIPGTPSSVATTFDAYPMTKRGEGGKALAYGVFASFLGSMLGFVALLLLAPVLGKFALRFGPYEYFALVVFTLTCIVSISRKSLLKGAVSALLGLFLAMVGLSEIDGIPRFVFGTDWLQSGFSVMPVLIGMFAVSQLLEDLAGLGKPVAVMKADFSFREFRQVALSFRHSVWNLIRSSLIGIGIGILPGTGSGLSNIVAYAQAKNSSREPDSFGTGNPDGIIASESSNNAATGGALIPLLTLGIPGDATTLMMIGAFMIHGVQPGPLLMRDHADLVAVIIIAYLVSNFFMLFLQINFIKLMIKALKLPQAILFPVIIMLCVVGSYALNSSMTDVWVFFGMGIAGYGLVKAGYPLLPLVLGLILGRMAESQFRAAYSLGGDSLAGFLERPIALFFFAVAALSLGMSLYSAHKRRAKEQAA